MAKSVTAVAMEEDAMLEPRRKEQRIDRANRKRAQNVVVAMRTKRIAPPR